MHAFVSKSDDIAYVILKVVDNAKAVKVLTSAGIKTAYKQRNFIICNGGRS